MRHSLLLLLLLCAACGAGDSEPGGPPSILLVTVDTLRYDALGCSGATGARTPNIDRLAAEGARYSNVWTACPLTLPSHATLLTGLLPPEHGLRDNDPGVPLAPRAGRDWLTLAEELKERGYRTGAFISASVLAERTGMGQGFDIYDGPSEGVPGALRYAERVGGDTARRAAEWLKSGEGPFFLWVHLFDPHDPYDAPEPFRVAAPPDSRAAYEAEVSYADHCVGLLSKALDDAGAAQDTLFLVTSDHGEGLGEHGERTHGYLLYETTIHVPLVARWPEVMEAGSLVRNTLSLAEIMPWLLAAADGDRASFQEGPSRRILNAETLYGYRHMGWAQLFAVREGTAKLVRGGDRALYDLATDPRELAASDTASVELEAAMNRYRALSARFATTGPAPDLPEGFPYAGGLGRSRLAVIPWEENRDRPTPDPTLASAIDAVKARVGRAPVHEVDLELRRLLERSPENPTLYFWIGRNAMKGRLHGNARRAYSRAFDLGLKEPKVLNLWLKEALLDGDLDAAGGIVSDHVPEIVPDTGTWVLVSTFHLESGDLPEARRCADLAQGLARTESERNLVKNLLSQFGHKPR